MAMLQRTDESDRLEIAKKLAILLVTLLPLIYLVTVLILIFSGKIDWVTNSRFGIVFLLGHITFMILSLALAAFYIVSVVKNKSLDSNAKIIWVIVVFQFNLFAMPVYWYRHIWHDGIYAGNSNKQSIVPW